MDVVNSIYEIPRLLTENQAHVLTIEFGKYCELYG